VRKIGIGGQGVPLAGPSSRQRGEGSSAGGVSHHDHIGEEIGRRMGDDIPQGLRIAPACRIITPRVPQTNGFLLSWVTRMMSDPSACWMRAQVLLRTGGG